MEISIAYSPDSDDAFMVHALKSGFIPARGYTFRFVRDDIQKLNDAAKLGVYDVTAISMAAYPSVSEKYRLTTVGASVGEKFGPAIVVKRSDAVSQLQDLTGKRIAVPGLCTSAYFAALGVIGAFEPVPMHFLEIAPAVANGLVDAGILIHELQMNPEASDHGDEIRKLADLGVAWYEKYALPLPLGANAIKRDLPGQVQQDLVALYKESIEWGLANRDQTLRQAASEATADYDEALGDKYISMYVNQHSLTLSSDVKRAFYKLIEVGAAHGACHTPSLDDAILH